MPEITVLEPPQQMPLPDPDELPAWVHAALDKWDTSNATYIGLRVLRENYAALRKPHALEQVENMAFSHLRHLATLWQFANFRTYVTSFELQVLEAEKEALQKPFALKRYTYQTMCRDGNGDVYWIDEEHWQHDRKWIVGFIQKRLGRYGAIMGEHQIQNTLNKLDAIYEVCESLEIEVRVYESHIQPLQQRLRKAS